MGKLTGVDMEPDDRATFPVSNCEVCAIPGTGYAFIRLSFAEDVGRDRRYVLSYTQLAQLKGEIDSVLRLWRDPVRVEPPMSHLH